MRLLISCLLLCQASFGAYSFRRIITLGQATTSDQASFDLLIQLDSSNAGTTMKTVGNGGHIQNTVTQSGGLPITIPADLIVTTDPTCLTRTIPWDVRAYDGTAGSFLARINAGTLLTASHVLVYVCYGDVTVTLQQNLTTFAPSAVYDTNTFGAWSMSDNAGTTVIVDAVATPHNATNAANTSGKSVTGQFGTGLSYNGTTDFSSVALNLSTVNLITMSYWLKWTTFAADDKLSFEFTTNGANQPGGLFHDPDNSGSTTFLVAMSSSGATWDDSFARPSAGAWHQYTIVIDRATPLHTVYVDGVLKTLTTVTHSAQTGNFANNTLHFMSRNNASLFGAGSMQELHIATTTRSAAWAATDFAAGSPLTFNTVGAETANGTTAIRHKVVNQ